MSTRLPQQLDELADLLARMCTASAGSLRRATAALVENRERLAVQVIAAECELVALRTEIEQRCVAALVLRQPVAGDLRAVLSTIHSAGDIDRMGRLALHIAEAVRRRHPRPTLPDEVRDDFAEMGRVAVALALKAADVVRSRNVLLAVELDADDDAMDVLHRHMFEVLMDHAWPHGVAAAVDITLLARYYERFADHAVSVAHGTVYAVTGQEPDAIPS